MKTLQVQQGSSAWAAERARRFTASEAPAMMGASKFQTRADLLLQKHTGIVPEVDAATQRRFDAGHATEAAARTLLEQELGDLFPVTVVHDTDDRLLASVDGITMDESTLFEHKLYSENLASQVRARDLEPHYFWQLEHQLLVTGAERVIFVTSDGTRERWEEMEYRPVAGRREQLIAGWTQFAVDLATYTPPAAAEPAAVAAPMESLPAVLVRMEGALTVHSNLDAFALALRAFVDKIPASPSTDQEFATCEAACKALKRAEDALEAEEERALAGMSDVEQMRRAVADLRELARTTRLQREKLVKARKEAIRGEIVAEGIQAMRDHIAGLTRRFAGQVTLTHTPPSFGDAIKGLKTVDSIRNAVATELARAKIEANALADRIDENLRALPGLVGDRTGLTPDLQALVLKSPEDFAAVVGQRVTAQREQEERRAAELAERERERIRREEAARVEREAQERAAAERRQQETAAAAERAAQAAAVPPAPAPTYPPAPPAQALATGPANVVPMPTKAPASPSTPPTLKLGQISERLGFTVTADFLASLGFTPAAVDKAAKLFHEAQFPELCDALMAHIAEVRDQRRVA